MSARKLLAVAVAATVLVGGVAATAAATPGNAPTNDHAPDDPGNGHAPDSPGNGTHAANRTADASNRTAGDSASASEHAPADRGSVGPPTDMPSVVPDKVTEIHQKIQAFLDGSIDNLGHALSDLLGDDGGNAGDHGKPGDATGNSTAAAAQQG